MGVLPAGAGGVGEAVVSIRTRDSIGVQYPDNLGKQADWFGLPPIV